MGKALSEELSCMWTGLIMGLLQDKVQTFFIVKSWRLSEVNVIPN